MEPIRYSDILRATGGEPAGPVDGDPVIEAVTTDSRDVPARSLFVPIRGPNFDGHAFMEQAFLRGASFTLVADDTDASRVPGNAIIVRDTIRALGDLARWHRSRFDVPVIGITGSCGKTTVKEMTHSVLGEDVVASHASYNNAIGVPLTLLRMDRSTRACVVEIGTNAPGEIAYLSGVARPTLGILTNVEEVHLEGLGTIHGVMREKAALLEALPERGAAIVNADNYYCREIMQDLRTHVVSFGTWEDADVYGVEPRATDRGIEFLLYGRMPIEVPVLGEHNVQNALAAVAAGLWLGREPYDIRDALARFSPPAMRMSRELVGGVVLINDAYNANPRSMDAAIRELVRHDCRGRRVAVLGEMKELGDQTERYHRTLGRKVANEGVDRLWAIGPNAAGVVEEAVRLGMRAEHVRAHESIHDALDDPAFEPEPGDAWLFKGSRSMTLERLAEHVREHASELDPRAVDWSVSRTDRRRP
ncbi:MAG: UDP-N-acetylmuramoyl-tripeptide--D-alanyl-D-alanine ligase [Planctomycetota bacterium]|nr:UDP-N-acetylmuramoyl-tripeptide--D-alanyl-D-alanine ligase [Planctomycetota bacterium]